MNHCPKCKRYWASGRICPHCDCELVAGLYSAPCSPLVELSRLTGTELDVCADIQKRQERGLAKYGVAVADNPLELKAWLQHAYEECLDQAIYLKRAMREIENKLRQ